jgi:hypothetical protein
VEVEWNFTRRKEQVDSVFLHLSAIQLSTEDVSIEIVTVGIFNIPNRDHMNQRERRLHIPVQAFGG